MVSSGGTANFITANTGGVVHVSNSGIASFITVNSGGYLYVSRGGTALQIEENGGYVGVAGAGASVTFIPNSFSGLVL